MRRFGFHVIPIFNPAFVAETGASDLGRQWLSHLTLNPTLATHAKLCRGFTPGPLASLKQGIWWKLRTMEYTSTWYLWNVSCYLLDLKLLKSFRCQLRLKNAGERKAKIPPVVQSCDLPLKPVERRCLLYPD